MLLGTKIIKNSKINIKFAAEILKKNNVIGIPTETVYGLGGRADKDEVVKRIFKIKDRPLLNPLILHYKNSSCALNDIFIDERAEELSKNFWPGPLTIVSRIKSKSISNLVTANLNTLAVRVPGNKTIRDLLQYLEFPIAAPSANRFGKISPTSAKDVLEELKNKIPFILDGGQSYLGIESTIIDLSTKKTSILRHGYITSHAIEKVLNLKLHASSGGKIIKAPGQNINHYQPDVPVRINAKSKRRNEAWLAFGEIQKKSKEPILSLSKKKCFIEASQNLYKMLRKLNKKNVTGIAVQKIPNIGLGIAINDRLLKASKKKKI